MISTAVRIRSAPRRSTTRSRSLARANGGGKLLAGGHSLIPLMKLRLSEPTTLIDIARIPGPVGHPPERTARSRSARAPSTTTWPRPRLLQQACPMLAEAAATIGDPQVRNRGTLGGSLAHADPAADYPAVMLALDADIHIKGPKGSRVVKAARLLPRAVHRRSRRRTRSSSASSSSQ